MCTLNVAPERADISSGPHSLMTSPRSITCQRASANLWATSSLPFRRQPPILLDSLRVVKGSSSCSATAAVVPRAACVPYPVAQGTANLDRCLFQRNPPFHRGLRPAASTRPASRRTRSWWPSNGRRVTRRTWSNTCGNDPVPDLPTRPPGRDGEA